jgi:hypothetical protein
MIFFVCLRFSIVAAVQCFCCVGNILLCFDNLSYNDFSNKLPRKIQSAAWNEHKSNELEFMMANCMCSIVCVHCSFDVEFVEFEL